jgi:hypothetical protein
MWWAIETLTTVDLVLITVDFLDQLGIFGPGVCLYCGGAMFASLPRDETGNASVSV